MEVGYNAVDNLEFIARSYDYASGGYERVGAVLREISVYIGKCIFCRQAGVLVGVRIPLRNFSVPFPLTDEAWLAVGLPRLGNGSDFSPQRNLPQCFLQILRSSA